MFPPTVASPWFTKLLGRKQNTFHIPCTFWAQQNYLLLDATLNGMDLGERGKRENYLLWHILLPSTFIDQDGLL